MATEKEVRVNKRVRRRRKRRRGGGGEAAYGFQNSVLVETGMYFICCYILQVHSVTEKEMPKGMKLKTKWLGEEKGNKMNVSLGGK